MSGHSLGLFDSDKLNDPIEHRPDLNRSSGAVRSSDRSAVTASTSNDYAIKKVDIGSNLSKFPEYVSTKSHEHMDKRKSYDVQPSETVATKSTDELKSNGRTEDILSDGTKVIKYRNGTIKEILVDGTTVVRFANGDTKTTNTVDGTVVYYYFQAQTKHTTYHDGIELYEFPNKQVISITAINP
jgi:hypothetical protein